MGKTAPGNSRLRRQLRSQRKALKQRDADGLRKTWTELWRSNLESSTHVEVSSPLEKILEWLTVWSHLTNYITVIVAVLMSLVYYTTFIIIFANEGLYLQTWVTGQILRTRTWVLYVPILFYFVSAVQIYHVQNDYMVESEADMIGLGGLFILIIAAFSLNDCVLLAKHLTINKYAQKDGTNDDLAKNLCFGFIAGLHEGASHHVLHPPAKLLANEFKCCGSSPIDDKFWDWAKNFTPPKITKDTQHVNVEMPEIISCCRRIGNGCNCYNEDPTKLNQQEYKMCLEPWWDMIRNVCIASYLTGIFYSITLYLTIFAYMVHYRKMKQKAKAMFGTKQVPYFIRRTESLARREQIKKLLIPRLRKRHAVNKKNKTARLYKYTLVQGNQSTTYTLDTRDYKGVRNWRKSRALKRAIARARACRMKEQNENPDAGSTEPLVTELRFTTRGEAKQSEKRLKKRILANKLKRYEDITKSKANLKPTLARKEGGGVAKNSPDQELTPPAKAVPIPPPQDPPKAIPPPDQTEVTDPNAPPETKKKKHKHDHEHKHKHKHKHDKTEPDEPPPV